MALESATYINQLNSSNPESGDPRSGGDDHLRMIKAALKNTFPNITGAVTRTHSQLNNAPYDTASMDSLLGGSPVTSAAFQSGVTKQTIQLGLHTASGRIRARVAGVDRGGLLRDLEFEGGNREMNTSQGFVRLPGGFELQWVTVTFNSGTPLTLNITLPRGFTTRVSQWAQQLSGQYNLNIIVTGIGTGSTVEVVVVNNASAATTAAGSFRLFVIGWRD